MCLLNVQHVRPALLTCVYDCCTLSGVPHAYISTGLAAAQTVLPVCCVLQKPL